MGLQGHAKACLNTNSSCTVPPTSFSDQQISWTTGALIVQILVKVEHIISRITLTVWRSSCLLMRSSSPHRKQKEEEKLASIVTALTDDQKQQVYVKGR